MKNLKFRVWHKESNEYLDSEFIIIQNGKVYDGFRDFEDGIDLGDEVIIEQYTGLKDMNGVDIYIGDIIKPPGEIFEVKNSGEIEILRGCLGLKVVGNIHENKDLLI